MIETKDIYWVAGLLEGEGCFFIQGKNGIAVTCGMTDEDVIQELYDILRVGKIYVRISKRENCSTIYDWRLTKSQDVAALLMTIYPLMGERRKAKIREMLQTWKASHIRSTHCGWGHEFTKENTGMSSNGYRECKICRRERRGRYKKVKNQDDYS